MDQTKSRKRLSPPTRYIYDFALSVHSKNRERKLGKKKRGTSSHIGGSAPFVSPAFNTTLVP